MNFLIPKQSLTLAGLTGIATLGLMWSSAATAPAIAVEQRREFETLLGQVIPPALHDNALQDDTVELKVRSGAAGELEAKLFTFARRGPAVSAVAFKTSAKGYAGLIEILMAVEPTGKVLGVRVTSHAETPGLGDKIEAAKSDWVYAFNAKSLEDPPVERWAVKKDGGDFDAFTGATITPRAVVGGIKAGLEMFERERESLLSTPTSKGAVP